MKELHTLGVAELGRALDAGQFSSTELTKHLLARVASHEHLGAFLCTDTDLALEQAAAADARIAAGERSPLLGVPLAHKDALYVRSHYDGMSLVLPDGMRQTTPADGGPRVADVAVERREKGCRLLVAISHHRGQRRGGRLREGRGTFMINRVVLATDGDFNVGITDREELKGYVERERGKGVFLQRFPLRLLPVVVARGDLDDEEIRDALKWLDGLSLATQSILLQRRAETMLVDACRAGLRGLVVDDLHFADEASLLLEAACESRPSVRWDAETAERYSPRKNSRLPAK